MVWTLSIIRAIFVIVCFPYVLSISKENDIKVIVEVLQSFNKPSDVIANLCWKDSTRKKLMVSLADSNTPRSIKFVNEIHAKDLVRTEQIIFLVEVSCKTAPEFLNKAASSKYFGRPYRWLVIAKANSEANIPPELDEMDFLPDSEVYVLKSKNNSYSINMTTVWILSFYRHNPNSDIFNCQSLFLKEFCKVYKIKANRDWNIENYGKWSADGGLVVSRQAIETAIAMRRRNLGRESIATSAVISDNSSLADLELLRYKEIDVAVKSGYHQLTPLYEFTNATRVLLLTNTWGYHINGTWKGMLGDLAEERAELAGLMFINKERMTIVDYLSHPTPSTVKFIFREPPLSYQNNLYILPFKASVWYCIGCFVVVLIVIIYVNAYWEAKKEVQQADNTTVLIPSVSDVTVFVMSAISQQGSNVELKGTLGRFVILILFLVFLFLYTAYSASIVVLLQSSSNQIRTLSDLLHSKLELGVEDTPYNRYWFENAKDPVRRAIYEKKIAPSGSKPKYFDIVDGVRQLQKKPFAFNCALGTAYKLMEKYFYEHEKCGLQEISYIQDNSIWLSCRKGSPYREIFKLGMLRNSEHGFNDRTNRIMFAKKPICSVRSGNFISVSLVDCYPILLLLLYGMILCVLLLLAEILHHRKTSRQFCC